MGVTGTEHSLTCWQITFSHLPVYTLCSAISYQYAAINAIVIQFMIESTVVFLIVIADCSDK